MTDQSAVDALRAALDAIEKAEREVIRLIGNGPGGRLDRNFRMSVPADPDRDSDLVLMDALSKARAALAASATDEPLRGRDLPDHIGNQWAGAERDAYRAGYAAALAASATEDWTDPKG